MCYFFYETDAEVTRSHSEAPLEGDISAVAAKVRQQNQGTTSISESNGAEWQQQRSTRTRKGQAEQSSSGDPNQGALDTASLQRAKTSDSHDVTSTTSSSSRCIHINYPPLPAYVLIFGMSGSPHILFKLLVFHSTCPTPAFAIVSSSRIHF